MARVNLDARFFGDPRIERLGMLTGKGKHDARGRLLGIWHYCYDQTQDVLTSDEINEQGEWYCQEGKDLAELLVQSRLAEKVEGGYRIKGAKERFEYILKKREAASKGGKASAKVRWDTGKQEISTSEADGKQMLSTRIPTDNPLALALVPALVPPQETTPPTPPSPSETPGGDTSSTKATGYTVEFERFWKGYPRKVGKGEAFKAWKKATGIPDGDTLEGVLDRQARSAQWQKDGGQYVPLPATWLNQRRWDDDLGPEVDEDGMTVMAPEEVMERLQQVCDDKGVPWCGMTPRAKGETDGERGAGTTEA